MGSESLAQKETCVLKDKALNYETEEGEQKRLKITLTIETFKYEAKKYLNGNEQCLQLLSQGMLEERSISKR